MKLCKIQRENILKRPISKKDDDRNDDDDGDDDDDDEGGKQLSREAQAHRSIKWRGWDLER